MKFGEKVNYLFMVGQGFHFVTGTVIGKWGDYIKIRTSNCEIKDVWANKSDVCPMSWTDVEIVKNEDAYLKNFIWMCSSNENESAVDPILYVDET